MKFCQWSFDNEIESNNWFLAIRYFQIKIISKLILKKVKSNMESLIFGISKHGNVL